MLEYIFTPKGGSGEDIYLACVDGCAGLLGMIFYVVMGMEQEVLSELHAGTINTLNASNICK